MIFDTTVHRAHKVELERIEGDGTNWAKLVITDVDGFRSIVNVFGTNGWVANSMVRDCETVIEELRNEIKGDNEEIHELDQMVNAAQKSTEEAIRTLKRANETKDEFCKLLDAAHETIAQMEDSYKMIESKLADAQAELRDDA